MNESAVTESEFAKFFRVQTPSSKVKATIVSQYFPQYCKIISRNYIQRSIWYMDLFAGPGKYDDGNWSTPLLIADICNKDQSLKSAVRFIFNDVEFKERLEQNFTNEFPENTFFHKPEFRDYNMENQDSKMLEYLKKEPIRDPKIKNPNPTVLFFDPFGYKTVDTLTLANFLGNWGNELFLFVNIKRITAALDNDKFYDNVQRLFPTSYNELQAQKVKLPHVYERTSLIIKTLISEFQRAIGNSLFSTAFKFMEEDSTGTSHFILHFTKHEKGYKLIKEVFYEYDNIGSTLEGDGTFTFDAKAMYQNQSSGLFNNEDTNMRNLASDLLKTYKGRTCTAKELFDEHHVNCKYPSQLYAPALRKLVDDGVLKAIITDDINHKYTVYLTQHCILHFN